MGVGNDPSRRRGGEEGQCIDSSQQGDSNTTERVPRGRCLPPVPPAPNPTRGEKTRHKSADQGASIAGKRQPRVVVVSQGRPDLHKPMPQWKRGYVAFKRKINSSVFMPLLVLLALCGAGIHIVGLAGVSWGYFRWSVECEGVLMVGDGIGRIDGKQIYKIGWAQYQGLGPNKGPDEVAMSSTDNGTVGADPSLEGVAGSSIPELDWLAGIDAASAALGAMTNIGHLLGSAFYAIMLSATVQLFRSYFRSCRKIFRPAFIASGVLLVWLLTVSAMGFYLAVRRGFTEKILYILDNEGFLCQDDSTIGGDFAYIATCFGCVTSAVVFFLIWRFGHDADFAVADRIECRGSLVELS